MNDTTRRGFLGLLAHLPVPLVLFLSRKPRTISANEIRAQISERNSAKERFGIREIRWIPVSENLPTIKPWGHNIFGIAGESELVLVSGDRGIFAARLCEYQNGRTDWVGAPLDSFSHWAAMPTGPTAEPPA